MSALRLLIRPTITASRGVARLALFHTTRVARDGRILKIKKEEFEEIRNNPSSSISTPSEPLGHRISSLEGDDHETAFLTLSNSHFLIEPAAGAAPAKYLAPSSPNLLQKTRR
ncbi:hypothetical protein BC938DRAFT_473086 [Jimgerdemannia flammicorona]|uniref:Uncharacterized protein n=1 Tax=Jimgerdemannia flammicorona TaxID=994334 RepID=A0A433Q4M4_9FUNG|nr:hypothetical protein BC938DRAFT_473086 [Jimgerdemannia flammicorona]